MVADAITLRFVNASNTMLHQRLQGEVCGYSWQCSILDFFIPSFTKTKGCFVIWFIFLTLFISGFSHGFIVRANSVLDLFMWPDRVHC